MDELIAFLRARLDEDEQAARVASPGPWQVDKETYPEAIHGADGATPVSGGRWGGEASVFDKNEDAIHIARYDPVRVLADVAAKRAIIDRAEELYESNTLLTPAGDALGELQDVVLPALALPYADHPDYREEWRP